MISETVVGNHLKGSERVDLASLTWSLLCSILVRPGDGRFSKYIVDGQGKIWWINPSTSFVEPTTAENGFLGYRASRNINFYSALCSFPLNTSLDQKVLEQFEKLEVHQILRAWIQDVIQKENEYMSLFSDKERTILDQENPNNPFLSTILLREGTLAELKLQFLCLKQTISSILKKSIPTIGDLLKELFSLREGAIGTFIHDAYNNSQPSPEARLKKAVSREQQAQPLALNRYYHASFGKIPSPKEIEVDKLYSPQKAYAELEAAYLQANNKYEFDFEHLKNDHSRQILVLKATGERFKKCSLTITSLVFRHSDTLTKALLEPFLNNQVESLEFQSCSLYSGFFEQITEMCPKLKKLTIGRLHGITRMIAKSLPSSLEDFQINYCANLEYLELKSPSIKNLDYANNPKLKEIFLDQQKGQVTVNRDNCLGVKFYRTNSQSKKFLEEFK